MTLLVMRLEVEAGDDSLIGCRSLSMVEVREISISCSVSLRMFSNLVN